MPLRTTLLTVMLVVAAAVALPVERIDGDAGYLPAYEGDARKDWQQQLPVASVAQKRDGYGPPSYSPPSYSEPTYHEPAYSEPTYSEPAYKPSGYKPHLPAYIKTFVKTDYHGNVKWGVKHNIAEVGSGYH